MAEDTTPTDALEKDERDTPDFWRRWVRAAEKAAGEHWNRAKAAWNEYECKATEDGAPERTYPIYWSSCKTLEPAYYSRTPKVATRRRFDIKDNVAMTASLVAQRLGQFLTDESDFDAVMQAAVQDFIHADKTTTQLLYSQETDETPQRITLSQQGDQYLDPDGQVWTEEVLQDEQGFFGQAPAGTISKQRIYLAACRYDEILHSPEAKCESEIREKAYYFYMSRDEAETRFGDKAKDIGWKSKKESAAREGEADHDRDRSDAVGEYVEGWECWSKPNKKVYWISTQYQGGFLDERNDPYKLKGFFPSPPFILGSKPSKHLYPTPAYHQLINMIDQLHIGMSRVLDLVERVRRKAIVDPSLEDVVWMLQSDDADDFVVAKNFASIVEKGGVSELIQFLPVQELVDAINELTVLEDRFDAKFNQMFGVPDLLRGQGDPTASATQDRLQAGAAHDRFKWQKKLLQQLASDSIQMMVDLALGVFSDDVIAKYSGFQFMSPEDQQRFPAALALLRDDESCSIRIEIESDSMSFVDEQMRQEQVNQAVQTMTQGLQQVSQMLEISPAAASCGLQALLISLDTLPAGKEFHDEVKGTLEALIEEAKKPKPEKPDLKMLKVQIEQQKLQVESQSTQIEAQIKMREADRKDYELQLKAGQIAADNQLKQFEAQLDQTMQQLMLQLEQQRVQIESFKAQMQARASEMEEIRLAQEADTDQYRAAVETAQVEKPEQPQPPVINVINVEKSQPDLPSIADAALLP